MNLYKSFIMHIASNGYKMSYRYADVLCIIIGVALASIFVSNPYSWSGFGLAVFLFFLPSIVLHIGHFVYYARSVQKQP